MEPFESYAKRMTAGEQMIIHLWALSAECANGGINQFLFNSSGDYAEETLEALREIGAQKQVEQFDKIRDTIFEGQPITKNREKRMSELLLFEGDEEHMSDNELDAAEKEAERFYNEIDEYFGWCDEIKELANVYVRTTPDEFPLH